jgi:hypothetical protein
MQDLGHGRQAVGGARGVGDDVVLGRVVGRVVHAEADRQVGALGGSRDDDLPGPSGEVGGRLVAVGEEPRALEHDVDAQVLPGQLGRVPLAEYADGLPVYDESLVPRRDVARQGPVHRVVLEEMGECLGIGEVVDGHELKPAAVLERGPQDVTTDAPKTVDTDLDCHRWRPRLSGRKTCPFQFSDGESRN